MEYDFLPVTFYGNVTQNGEPAGKQAAEYTKVTGKDVPNPEEDEEKSEEIKKPKGIIKPRQKSLKR